MTSHESRDEQARSFCLATIWAQAHGGATGAGGAIGAGGAVPWYLPEDLALFKQLTLGSPVIMGRRTWESLEPRFRPLPGRTNIVVTHQTDFSAAGAIVSSSLDEALAQAADMSDLAWLIGGASLYQQGLARSDYAVVTDVDVEVQHADAFAPRIPFDWPLVDALPERGWLHSRVGHNYRVSVYKNPHTRTATFGAHSTNLAQVPFSLPRA